MKEKILTVGNWIFVPIERSDHPTITKYISLSRSGRADLSTIWNYEEIVTKFPDVISHEYLVCVQDWTNHQ